MGRSFRCPRLLVGPKMITLRASARETVSPAVPGVGRPSAFPFEVGAERQLRGEVVSACHRELDRHANDQPIPLVERQREVPHDVVKPTRVLIRLAPLCVGNSNSIIGAKPLIPSLLT